VSTERRDPSKPEGKTMDFVDKTGVPRPTEDVEAALQAVKERIVKGPHDVFTMHLIVVKDVLEAELRAREARGG